MLTQPSTYVKAILAALFAGLSAASALTDHTFTHKDWITIAIAVVVSFATVYNASNAPIKEPLNGKADRNPNNPGPSSSGTGVA